MKILFMFLAAVAGCDSGTSPGATPPADTRPITVFAASSLRDAATAIAGPWSKRSGRKVQFQFEATSTLARQIREGAKADLFLTASPEWLDQVKTLDRFDWLSNRLVLVVPRESGDVDLKSLESLALAGEQVPAGKYARAALTHLGVKLPERTIYGSNVRDVLSKVSQGGARAGVVYTTDATIDPAVRVAYTFPAESHPKIIYSAGLLTEGGRALYASLHEPWALEIARGYGFTGPD
jgi:molybdate transport system substrate-binding protein